MRRNRRPFTEAEVKYLQQSYGKTTISVMARRLGRAPGTVFAKLESMGLHEVRLRPWTNKELEFLKENADTLCHKCIGKILNRSPGSVGVKIHKLKQQRG